MYQNLAIKKKALNPSGILKLIFTCDASHFVPKEERRFYNVFGDIKNDLFMCVHIYTFFYSIGIDFCVYLCAHMDWLYYISKLCGVFSLVLLRLSLKIILIIVDWRIQVEV